MSLSAAALQLLLDKGLSLADVIELAGVIEASSPKAKAETPGAQRTRRWRERKADASHSDVTVTHHGDVTEPPSPSSFPPNPPNTNPCPRSVTSRERDAREDAAFGSFWAAYPRKVSKADARKAFTRAWRKLPPFDEESILVGGLERAKAAWTDAQFIPYAATWLNGERWNDEPEPLPPSPPNGPRPTRTADARKDAYLDRLADVAAAMDAGLQQPRGGH